MPHRTTMARLAFIVPMAFLGKYQYQIDTPVYPLVQVLWQLGTTRGFSVHRR